jgi:hypothetical protein
MLPSPILYHLDVLEDEKSRANDTRALTLSVASEVEVRARYPLVIKRSDKCLLI